MNTSLIIDKADRVGIPNPLRGTGTLAEEHGVWVFRSGDLLPASANDELLQQIREERDLANLGKSTPR